MLEMLQTGKALYALAAIGAIGAISKLITRSLYKRLIRETDNMAMTKNRNLKALKQKLENACRLNQNIVNTEAYLERQMYGFRFMKISLNSWNNLSAQMTILGIMAGGAASFAAYWYRLDSYYIVLYASAGAFLGLALAFLDSSFSIGLKQQRLANALLEYTDNSVLVRAFRENAGQQERFQDSARRLPVREADTDELSEREAIIRENAIRDGLIKEAVKMPERQREAEDKASLFRAKKADKPAGLKRLKAEKTGRVKKTAALVEEKNALFQNLKEESQNVPSAQEPSGEGIRDIDYLKHSLEQIAASRERSKQQEEWTKNLKPEEMKALGELLRQYLSAES